ncbi:MAG TPA: DUF2892 domain-containing protein [Gemmatimonadales bacterium]|jgi:hypothetical protein
MNVGRLDALVRAIIGVALLFVAGLLHEIVVLSLGIGLAAVYVCATGITRRCWLYSLLDLTTRRERML